MTWAERKKERIARLRKGAKKSTKCIACNGSGHYDDSGSPECDACAGTGKVKR